jgi:hypothetical protein
MQHAAMHLQLHTTSHLSFMKARLGNRLLDRLIVAAYHEIVPKIWMYSVLVMSTDL